MNAVEIEEAISALAEQPFDHDEFPFAFFQAFGNKPTTIKRLRAGSSNKSDQSGVLGVTSGRGQDDTPSASPTNLLKYTRLR